MRLLFVGDVCLANIDTDGFSIDPRIAELLGLPPGVMLAVSLATRARDLIIGVPALISWQLSEGAAWRRTDQAMP